MLNGKANAFFFGYFYLHLVESTNEGLAGAEGLLYRKGCVIWRGDNILSYTVLPIASHPRPPTRRLTGNMTQGCGQKTLMTTRWSPKSSYVLSKRKKNDLDKKAKSQFVFYCRTVDALGWMHNHVSILVATPLVPKAETRESYWWVTNM